MKIKPIRTKKDHKEALSRIDVLWPMKTKAALDEIEVLSTLVAAYEHSHTPILPPDPIEAIKFRMEQLGISKSELGTIVGGRNRASELLSGKRRLTVKMIKSLHKALEIPAESLIS